MRHFIAIAGNIGVGKSSLVERLCSRLGWEPFYEGVVDNPYLADFYADMSAWSFHSQVFFLARRIGDLRHLMDIPRTVVQDRSVYEDAEVFAKNLYLQGSIAERDWRTYSELYTALTELLPAPDLIIYLEASLPTLVRRIYQRGRHFEKEISPDYVQRLNQLYNEWISRFNLCPVLRVPADRLDFVSSAQDLDLIVEKVQDKLRGDQLVLFE